ncbi:MAG: DUF423 domain-containing protein [Verrucomicrobiae bacterium]|nr:DUF423 domain-containing protein [Verrucomicrobiae bacterium]
MKNGMAIRIAALLGFLAVALGAFGAHGLEGILTRHNRVATWETAVFYHAIHTVVLLVLALRKPLMTGPWWSLFAGILIFSGSLYLLSLSNVTWLGAITPIGGVSFLVGWLWLMVSAGKADS